LVVIAGIIFAFYYQSVDAKYKRLKIITIDNVSISSGEFLDKCRITGTDPMSMLQTVTEEELFKIMAPVYGIEVTKIDVDNYLRNLAAGDGETISDVEFREWYRQKLNDNNMSDSQYREIVSNQIRRNYLDQYVQDRVPTVQPQVLLNWIVVETLDEAEKVEARLDAGESFAALAKEVSLDTSTRDNGGEIGWIPPAVSTYESQISKLEVNQYTTPIGHYADTSTSSSSSTNTAPDSYFIFMVSQKDPAHEVDDTSMSTLKSQALSTWFNDQVKYHNVKYNFNSEIYAWLNYQLEKNNTSSVTTTTTTGSSSGS